MKEPEDGSLSVDQFLREQIDTVPHLEALLLLWKSRPKPWSVGDMAKGLFVSGDACKEILEDLTRRGLLVAAAETYRYEPRPDRDDLSAP